MEKCVNCTREYAKQSGMLFCPYCGNKFDQITLSKDINLTEKIENIWGNQGVYAEKVKALSLSLIEKLKNNIKDIHEEKYSAKSLSIVADKFEDQFDSLMSAQSEAQFYGTYFDLMGKINAILSGSSLNISGINIQKITLVKEAILSYENSLELPFKSNMFFNVDMSKSENRLDDISKELLFELYSTLEVAFNKMKIIISEFGLFCITNSDFNKHEARVLRDINFIDNDLVNSDGLKYCINLLNENNNKSDSVISNDDSDLFVLLVIESLWLFIKATNSYFSTPRKDEVINQLFVEMKKWLENIEVCIDRSKYSNTVAMIDVYQRVNKFVYSFPDKSYQQGE